MTAKKRNLKIYIPLVTIVLLVVALGIYWYVDYVSFIRTDDAYVTSDIITVSPKITGRISKEYFQEGDSVKMGQLVAEIDSTDLLAQKEQLKSVKNQSETGKIQAQAKYELDTKNITVQKIALEKAQEDYNRAKTQINGGVITREQFDHITKALEIAKAQYDASKSQIQLSKTQIQVSEAAIKSSQSQIGVIQTQLKNTKLFAPSDGVIAKRWLLPGDMVNVGQSIFTINYNLKFWINIFLEETKVQNIHLGQNVSFAIDTYPDVKFFGKVFMIGSTTASQFSLIPASNASGNFTKVTQRVQLKVSIDGVEGGKKLSDYRLMTGMSAVVKIIK